jgi:hypothetical protein
VLSAVARRSGAEQALVLRIMQAGEEEKEVHKSKKPCTID